MNVYMLTSLFASETVDAPKALQSHVENTFRRALGAVDMADQFSRVSLPYADRGMQMAVVCSESAAKKLRGIEALGIESLVLDIGRTNNLRAVTPKLRRQD